MMASQLLLFRIVTSFGSQPELLQETPVSKGRTMNRTKVLAAFLAAGMALSGPVAAFAKNPHGGGGGGGGGGSQAGGLPALAKRVTADEALIKELKAWLSPENVHVVY